MSFLTAIVHYIGRSLGMDCECDNYHLCEVIALGSGKHSDFHSYIGHIIAALYDVIDRPSKIALLFH